MSTTTQTSAAFTDSDLVAFAHETDRRATRPTTSDASRDLAQRLLRSAPNPRDSSLSSLAQAWLDRLAPPLRPFALCERFPRIANRLALCWNDPTLTAMLFRELLTDQRGNRRGYPPEVQRELLNLRDGTST
jgi:hypothetical protein